MIINRIVIKTHTFNGLYGANIKLNSGLNIIRAENTSGKSTIMQAILFALGLEGTLGPSRKLPLKSALTKELKDEDGNTIRVSNTDIFLEIEHNNKRITVKRSAHEDNNHLITVWNAHTFSDNSSDRDSSDYYVRLPGSATMEKGFHSFFADFLNLKLPLVIKYDGGKSPLYLEALFSLYNVEQTRGWGSIQNTLPTYLGIKDVGSKAIEYVLDLDSFEIHSKRQDINEIIREVEKKWGEYFTTLTSLAIEAGGQLSSVPDKPHSELDGLTLSVIIILDHENRQKTILEEINTLRDELNTLQQKDIPTINQASEQIQNELNERLAEISKLDILATTAQEDSINISNYITSISQRISSLNEDRRKYKDVKRLIDLGSKNSMVTQDDICPTCHQALTGSLIEGENIDDIYDVNENIQFIESQINMFKNILQGEKVRHEKAITNIFKINNRLNSSRDYVRSLKSSLISDGRIPSKAAIKKELELESEIEKLEYITEEFSLNINKLEHLSKEYEKVISAKKALPRSHLSALDHQKISELKKLFSGYLSRFEYKSESPDKFEISDQTYKPTIDGVELGFNSSASDNIRMIWAYLYALLSLSQSGKYKTNHIGLLMLDEPRQQEAKELSFKEFINVTSESNNYGQQVIMATSEDYTKLADYCENIEVNLVHFEEDVMIIAPLTGIN